MHSQSYILYIHSIVLLMPEVLKLLTSSIPHQSLKLTIKIVDRGSVLSERSCLYLNYKEGEMVLGYRKQT